ALVRNRFMPAICLPADERLNDSMLADGIDQFLQAFWREIFPGLQWTRIDTGQTNVMNVFARIDIFANRRGATSDEGAQTLTETGLRHLRHVSEAIGTTPITQMTTRCYRCTLTLILFLRERKSRSGR